MRTSKEQTVQKGSPDSGLTSRILRGRSYSVRRAAGEVCRELEPGEVVALVRERFALGLTAEESLRALGDG